MLTLAKRIADEKGLQGKELKDYDALVNAARRNGKAPSFWAFSRKDPKARQAFLQLKRELQTA